MSLQSESHIFQGRGMGSWGRRSVSESAGPSCSGWPGGAPGRPRHSSVPHHLPWLGQSSLRVARGQLTKPCPEPAPAGHVPEEVSCDHQATQQRLSPRPSSPVQVQAGTPRRASLVGCLGLVEPGLGLPVQRQLLPVLPGPYLARWCVQAELCLVRSPWSSWPECRLPPAVGGALQSCRHPLCNPTPTCLPSGSCLLRIRTSGIVLIEFSGQHLYLQQENKHLLLVRCFKWALIRVTLGPCACTLAPKVGLVPLSRVGGGKGRVAPPGCELGAPQHTHQREAPKQKVGFTSCSLSSLRLVLDSMASVLLDSCEESQGS